MGIQNVNRAIFITFCLYIIVSGQDPETSTQEDKEEIDHHVPIFVSKSGEFTVREGYKHINLQCEVDRIGGHSTVWQKAEEVLFADTIRLTKDDNIMLEPDRSLSIKHLSANHSGTYTCSISSDPKIFLEHVVNVLVPPKLIQKPNHEVTLQKGQVLNLTCDASGNPPPTITWKKLEGPELPNGSPIKEGGSFVGKPVKRYHTGNYECTANNGIGEPASAMVKVHVLYPPEIDIENSVVHSGEGVSSELTCLVHADPVASLHWEKNGKKMHTSEHHRTSHSHNRHILHIKRVKEEDLGTYTCVAKNPLNTSRGKIELSGLATPIVFKSNPNGNERDAYTLKWATNSYSGVIDYLLKIREKPDGDVADELEWRETITIPAESQTGLMQSQMYKITGLKEATSYEVVMLARNKYGWNQESSLFAFATEGKEVTSHQPFEESPNMADEQGDEDSTSGLVDAYDAHKQETEDNGNNAASIPEVGLFSLLTVFILSAFF